MTGTRWFNASSASILTLTQLVSRLVEPVQDELDQLRRDVYGDDGTLGTAKAALTYVGAQQLAVEVDKEAIDGSGSRLLTEADAAWTDIPYPDSPATTFYVGAQSAYRPYHVTAATVGSVPTYDQYVEDVGEMGPPDLVTDTGTGLAFRVSSFVTIWNSGSRAKRVVVWMVNPVTGDSDAIYEGNAVPSAGQIVLTVPHYLGQTGTPSTTVGDYRVCVRGPRISTVPLGPQYWQIGTVNTGVTSVASQSLLQPALSAFLVEHNSSGNHTLVTGGSVALAGTSGFKLKSTGTTDADVNNNAQWELLANGGVAKVEMWADHVGGGKIRFPNANLGTGRAGATLDVRQPGAGAVELYITNDRSATDYAFIHYDGVLEWIPSKVGAPWAIRCNVASDQVLTIVNTDGGGVASIDVEGDVDVGRDLGVAGDTFLQGAIVIIDDPSYWTFPTRTWRISIPMFAVVDQPDAVDRDCAVAPPKLYPTALGTTVVNVPLPVQDFLAHGWRLQDIAVRYRSVNAGDVITAQLMSQTGVGAPAGISSLLSATVHTSTWSTTGMTESALDIELDPVNVYFFQIIMTPDAAGIGPDTQVSDIVITLYQGKLA